MNGAFLKPYKPTWVTQFENGHALGAQIRAMMKLGLAMGFSETDAEYMKVLMTEQARAEKKKNAKERKRQNKVR